MQERVNDFAELLNIVISLTLVLYVSAIIWPDTLTWWCRQVNAMCVRVQCVWTETHSTIATTLDRGEDAGWNSVFRHSLVWLDCALDLRHVKVQLMQENASWEGNWKQQSARHWHDNSTLMGWRCFGRVWWPMVTSKWWINLSFGIFDWSHYLGLSKKKPRGQVIANPWPQKCSNSTDNMYWRISNSVSPLLNSYYSRISNVTSLKGDFN